MALRTLAAPVVLTAALLAPAPPASAGGTTVTVSDNAFTPASLRVALDGRVTWEFPDQVQHTTTSDQGFWDSGTRNAGESFDETFTSAGSFAYHCEVHPHMRGTVRVSLTATGSAADGWRLRWATVKAGAGRDYDVQVKAPGGKKWRFLRRDTAKPTTGFDPATAGAWRVRARTSNTDAGESSGWSPTRKVTVA